MAISIGHTTALDYWRLCRASFSRRSMKRMFEPPVHLVAEHAQRTRSSKFREHAWKHPLPRGAYCVPDNLRLFTQERIQYISSPEFCFFQMASQLCIEELVLLALEFCGRYTLPPGTPFALQGFLVSLTQADKEKLQVFKAKGFMDCEPLTTPKRLESFAMKMEGRRGRRRALRALRFVREGSASPMESVLFAMLVLPCSLGGYGLPMPVLNQRVDVAALAKKVTGSQFYECDLFWPEKNLDVEYDSKTFHSGKKKISKDSKKRNALEHMGIRVVTVTWEQISDPIEMNRIARIIAGHLGVRLRRERFLKRQPSLRKLLLKRR